MSVYANFALSLALTLVVAIALTLFLRATLRGILVELCGTERRADFWTLFSTILLIAMPLVIALGYTPETGSDLFFEMAHQVGRSMFGYLFTLVIVGGCIAVFVLFSPRPKTQD